MLLFYGITCLTRLIYFAVSFTAFEKTCGPRAAQRPDNDNSDNKDNNNYNDNDATNTDDDNNNNDNNNNTIIFTTTTTTNHSNTDNTHTINNNRWPSTRCAPTSRATCGSWS